MPLKRFSADPDFSSDALLIVENFGLTVYVAQLYEGFLGNALTGLERLGVITIPLEARRSNNGFVDENLGSMLRILESQGTLDRKSSKLLKKAHYQRNLLVHSFLAESSTDLLNDAGRNSVNDKLHNIYSNIRIAMAMVSALSEKIWAQLGVSPEYVQREMDEVRRLAENAEDDELHQ